MKTTFAKVLSVFSLVLGLGAVQNVKDAQAEPSCPGSGQTCATAPDGTVYEKGQGY